MATPEQIGEIQRVMEQQQAAIEALTNQLTQAQQQSAMASQQAAQAQQQAHAAQAQATSTEPQRSSGFSFGQNRTVDTRVLGKPDTFEGTPGTWRDWSTIFRAYAAACEPDLLKLMTSVENKTTPCLNVSLDPSEAKLSEQLYYMMIMLNKGASLDRVVSAGSMEGAEAWRLFVQHHEPTSQTRSAGLLQELLAYDFDGDVTAKILSFDRSVHRYEQSTGDKFPENIRIGVLLRRLPEGALKQHMLLNSTRLTTWEAVKLEVENLRRAQIAVGVGSNPVPMEVDALSKQIGALTSQIKGWKGKSAGKGTKGKDSGKGRGAGAPDNLPTNPCPICGRMGHWKKDCWYNAEKGAGRSPSGGKGQKGKGGRGSGKDSGKGDQSRTKCWKCGDAGHISRNCPKKTINEVAEPEPHGDIGGLFLAALESVAEKQEAAQGRMVSFGIDSGAAVTAIPTALVDAYPLTEPPSGAKYLSATGEDIHDKGMKKILAETQGTLRGIRARVADIRRPLMSVFDMYEAGHRVVFDKNELGEDQSHAVHKETGTVVKFILRNRTWDLDVKLVPPDQLSRVAGQIRRETETRSAGVRGLPLCPFRGPATPL